MSMPTAAVHYQNSRRFNCSTISDHFPIVYVYRYEIMCKTPKYSKQMCRPITVDNINKFKLALAQTDWSILENINDTNLAYNTFLSKFIDI